MNVICINRDSLYSTVKVTGEANLPGVGDLPSGGVGEIVRLVDADVRHSHKDTIDASGLEPN